MKPRTVTRRRFISHAAAGFAWGAAPMAMAQSDWPKAPIKLVVPYAPGGMNDIVMRLVSRHVADRIGQPIVIDNRPGAGGIVGTNAVTKAAPDGYTIGAAATSTLIATPLTNPQSSVDVIKDLAFVSLLATAPMLLTVNASLPVRNAAELLKHLQANRNKLNFGSMAVGHFGHVTILALSESADAAMVHSAYKGEAPLLQDLVGNHIQLAFVTPPVVKPMAEAGKLRLLAVSGTKRLKLFPDVATLIEQGFDSPIFRMNAGWMGIVAPAKTPPAIVQRLSEEYAAAIRHPDINEQMMNLGLDPIGSNAESFRATYLSEKVVWRDTLIKAGIEVK